MNNQGNIIQYNFHTFNNDNILLPCTTTVTETFFLKKISPLFFLQLPTQRKTPTHRSPTHIA
jgi:hypothetical protein